MKKTLLLSLLALSSLSIASFAQEASATPPYIDGMVQWNKINTANNLPHDPIAIAASPVSGDFVAIASDYLENDYSVYFLDHANLNNGWQKKNSFAESAVYNAAYKRHSFLITARDLKGKLVLINSFDNGLSWQDSKAITLPFISVGSDTFLGTGSDDSISIFQLPTLSGKTDFVAIGSDSFEPVTLPYSFHNGITADASNGRIDVGISKDGSSYYNTWFHDQKKQYEKQLHEITPLK